MDSKCGLAHVFRSDRSMPDIPVVFVVHSRTDTARNLETDECVRVNSNGGTAYLRRL